MTATMATRESVEPLPAGFRIVLDSAARELEPGVWLGGQPRRLLQLTGAGRAAWAELCTGAVTSRAGGVLARRLVDAGLAHPVPPPAQTPEVTVVVPVHDRTAGLDRCLTGLGHAYPVLVVDDASTDATAVREVANRHGARLIRLPVNRGPAAARNAGLSAVDTELVAFLDSDTIPNPDWIQTLAAHLQDPLVAAAAPRITPLTGPGLAGSYVAARSALDLGTRPTNVRPYTTVSYLPSAALLARRAALAGVARAGAVFDPALRMGEDVDLIWRLTESGWRVRYQPEVTVAHAEPTRWRDLLYRRYRYGTSAAALACRHPGSVAPLVIHRWYTATVLATLASRPTLAAAGLAVAAGSAVRAAGRSGLPTGQAVKITAHGLGQSWLGIARYASQFAAPALLVALATGRPRHRLAAAALLTTPALAGWSSTGRRLDPARYTLAALADEIAYGTGVLTGCVRQRTARPLVPVSSRTISGRRGSS